MVTKSEEVVRSSRKRVIIDDRNCSLLRDCKTDEIISNGHVKKVKLETNHGPQQFTEWKGTGHENVRRAHRTIDFDGISERKQFIDGELSSV